jgi:hypothetical protein
MKWFQLIPIATLVLATQASALDSATLNAASTLKVYFSGANVRAVIGGLFAPPNCAAGTRTDYTLPAANAGFSTIYTCTLAVGNGFGLPAGTNVAFQKRDEGDAVFGIFPVANGTPIQFIDPTTCTGPATGIGNCSGQFSRWHF